MKLSIFVLSLIICTAMGAARIKRRSSSTFINAEKEESKTRVYDVITETVCESENRSLEMCNALRQDKKKLKRAVEDHRCMFQHLINSTSGGNSSINNGTTEWFSDVLKSDAKTSSISSTHNIKKRSSPSYSNPCKGSLQQRVVYYGEDIVDGRSYELVHDPANYLYQTFFLWTCNNFIHQDFRCVEHEIIFKSLVFVSPPGGGFDVDTKVVRIMGSCALSNASP